MCFGLSQKPSRILGQSGRQHQSLELKSHIYFPLSLKAITVYKNLYIQDSFSRDKNTFRLVLKGGTLGLNGS